jgi:hypothetical protein
MDCCFDVRRCDVITISAKINFEKNTSTILKSSTDPPAEPDIANPPPHI